MSTKKRKLSKTMVALERVNKGPLTLNQLIESIRIGDEMSQVNFAKKLGISKSHLCDLEKGRKLLSPARAARFARILGYSEAQFVQLVLQDMVKQASLPFRVRLEAA